MRRVSFLIVISVLLSVPILAVAQARSGDAPSQVPEQAIEDATEDDETSGRYIGPRVLEAGGTLSALRAALEAEIGTIDNPDALEAAFAAADGDSNGVLTEREMGALDLSLVQNNGSGIDVEVWMKNSRRR